MARDPFESYLKKAVALFEGGDVVQAGQIWQAILKKSPDHAEARAGLYKVKLYFDARATQDGLASEQKKELAAQSAAASAPAPAPAGGPAEIVRLLEQGCTLYDAGHLEDAIAKWNQVLEKDPHNVLARGYITGAQRVQGLPVQEESGSGEPRSTSALPSDLYLGTGAVALPSPVEQAVPAPPAAPALDKDEVDRLLRDGCTLYDMGQPQDALRKWEQLLTFDPSHELARAYIKDARRDLGLDTLSDGAIPAPVDLPPTGVHAPEPIPSPLPVEDQDRVEQLIREGTQLFDMGMTAEAIQKWELVLAQVPGHKDVEAYLAMARRETDATPKVSAAVVPDLAPAPKPSVLPKPDEFEPNLRKGESLLHQGRFEEAAFLFQEVIKVSPQNFRALQGLHQAEALLQAREATHTAPPAQLYPPTPPLPGVEWSATPPSPLLEQSPGAEHVEPPSALTAPAPPARKGLELPELLRQMEAEIPAWLKRPRTLFAILGGIVLLNAGYMIFRWKRGESLLKEKTVSFREEALANVARNLEIANLEESPDAIRREAEGALSDDPLRAYYRGQELIRLNPLDGPAAQLMGRASTAMAQADGAGQGSVQEVERLLQGGELDSAERMLLNLLRKNPDDADLKARMARLSLALTQIYAAKESWGDAEDRLKRGRAMYPGDKAWRARLVFLGRIRAMGAEERKAWIRFLG